MSSYEIRLYDTKLLTFSINSKGLEGLDITIEHIYENNRYLFPLDLDLSPNGILKWIDMRVIPKNRIFVEEILKTLKLSINNKMGIIDVCKGLSLNDSYWVVPKGFNGKFINYNLYENRFSEILSLVAYTGIGNSNFAFTTSPELTTGGMLPKAWRFIENDGIYLYKGGTTGFANAGNEPYSEFYAYQIAECMGLNAIEYKLEKWKGILASKCKLFTNINTSYIPIGRIIKTGGIPACLNYYENLSIDDLEHIKSMLVFDAVIYNEDRHFGNFGILRDNHTGKVLKAAPIFDNGISLFNFAILSDFDNIDEYAKTRTPPYNNISFEDICKSVVGKLQTSQLRKLISFKFKRHPQANLNLPEKRLIAIEKHIQKRIIELLNISK